MIKKLYLCIKEKIGQNQFDEYFLILEFIKNTEDELVFKAPNQFIAKFIQTKFAKTIQECYEQISGKKIEVSIGCGVKKKKNQISEEKAKPLVVLNDAYTFDNFIIGESNTYAYEVCKSITKDNNFGNKFNPIFIYSSTGLGKTHLLHATGHLCLESNKKIIYKTSKGFMNDFQNAVFAKKEKNFGDEYKDCDLLLIDDIQFLGNSEQIQEEFFHIFNDIVANGGQILMTSDVAPKQLKGMTDRLKSRFANGIITNITVPNYETKKAIIRKKCDLNDMQLSDEILNTIANFIGENIRELESIIANIIAAYNFTKQKITLEYVNSLIKEYINDRQNAINLDDIFEFVSHEFNIKISDIRSNSKKKDVVRAKRIVIFLSKELLALSVREIADSFNMKDHSAVSHHIRKTNEMLLDDHEFRQLIENIKNKILTSKDNDF